MSALMLVAAVFCCVSGGPFGLEEAVEKVGPSIALLLILLMPFIWALPDSLTTCELAPAIPEEGGYVVWVRRAMGPFWGFINAWWTMLYAILDAALYPILFSEYFATVMSEFGGVALFDENAFAKWGLAFAVIVVMTMLNVRGIRIVGTASIAFALAILAPFLVMIIIGIVRAFSEGMMLMPTIDFNNVSGSMGTGMAIVMWNYLGWDQLSTVAEEVEEPHKAYPRAMLIGVPLVTLAYLMPVVVGLAFVPYASSWSEGAWPAIAREVGGGTLSMAMSIAALVSPIALFTASVLGSSRIPMVLAEQKFLPSFFSKVHSRFGTPYVALIVMGGIFALLAVRSFVELVELNVIMYCAALALESLALIVLRVKEPNLPRPFKIPGGYPVLFLVFLLPVGTAVTMSVFSFMEEGWVGQRSSIIALASAPVVYLIVKAFRKV